MLMLKLQNHQNQWPSTKQNPQSRNLQTDLEKAQREVLWNLLRNLLSFKNASNLNDFMILLFKMQVCAV